jgi:two-component system response regulator AtoC
MGDAQKILIADDEENIRRMLELHLVRDGFEVTTAADGTAALEALTNHHFDAAICDLVMPGMDGLELLKALGGLGIETPIILMSAHATVDTALEAIAEGAFDYIPKPFPRIDEVLFRLKRALTQTELVEEVDRLKEALGEQAGLGGIIARSKPMMAVFDTIRKVADYKTTVLVTGESGTGKELVAKALHFNSIRAKQPFVAVNCGAIPENLLESELFGHVRGAFTDATRTRRGLFEEANNGTLFLDEIGELPIQLQVKLLRVLQENEVRRVGDSHAIPINVRLVAATVRDLAKEVKEGGFREDLFYRLNVLQLRLPALRERKTDIPLLVDHFVDLINERLETQIEGFDPEATKLMMGYGWPGNVRELENTIERAIVLCDGDKMKASDLPPRIHESQDRIHSSLASGELSIKKTTRIIEEELIRRALTKTGGNRTHAAELLELSHRALLYKIKQYEIDL